MYKNINLVKLIRNGLAYFNVHLVIKFFMAPKPVAKRELTVVQFWDTFYCNSQGGSQGMEAFPVQVLFVHLSVKPSGVRLSI